MRSEDMPLALKILIWSVLSKSFQLIISIVEVWYWSLIKCLKRPCGESTVEILSLLMQQRPRRERNNHKFENIIWHKDYKKPFFCGKSLPKGYSSNNRILLTTTFWARYDMYIFEVRLILHSNSVTQPKNITSQKHMCLRLLPPVPFGQDESFVEPDYLEWVIFSTAGALVVVTV